MERSFVVLSPNCGAVIRDKRHQRGFTALQMSQALLCSQEYYRKLERDVFKRANPMFVRRLAELLKIDEKQLWVGE